MSCRYANPGPTNNTGPGPAARGPFNNNAPRPITGQISTVGPAPQLPGQINNMGPVPQLAGQINNMGPRVQLAGQINSTGGGPQIGGQNYNVVTGGSNNNNNSMGPRNVTGGLNQPRAVTEGPTNMENSVATGTTYMPVWNIKLVWEVQEFENVLNLHSYFNSPKYILENRSLNRKLQWYIALENNTTHLQMLLSVVTESPSWNGMYINCTYKIDLGEPDGTTIVRKGQERFLLQYNVPLSSVTPLHVATFPVEQLMGQKERIYPTGILRIMVNIHIITPIVTQTGARVFPVVKSASETSIEKWTAGFYNNSLYSDVTIKCQDKVYPCHRQILGRSTVFAAIFSNDMKEAISKQIVISDVDPTVLEMFLKTMYCQPFDLPVDYKELLELTDCAERYDLAALKSQCLRYMTSMLSDENAGELNVAAHRYSQDPDYHKFFKDYCYQRQIILMKNPAYKKTFLENIEFFV